MSKSRQTVYKLLRRQSVMQKCATETSEDRGRVRNQRVGVGIVTYPSAIALGRKQAACLQHAEAHARLNHFGTDTGCDFANAFARMLQDRLEARKTMRVCQNAACSPNGRMIIVHITLSKV